MDQWPSVELIIEHTEQIDEAAVAAVRSVSCKEADILMKGDIATKNILKAALNKEYGLRTGKILTHVALFEIPNQERLIFLTDAAMNIAPDLQQKAEIINNAVQ
ncbi:phosphate acyltransferase, partial [Virgibacillus salexigens]|uniref:phosphate acyltransferase n=1 Tax=Virgibacillus massiliensis TaxID=1462526 RepID=UPI0022B7D436